MSEMTTGTSAVVDEKARFRAFTAVGLALTALAGGGLLANATQLLAMWSFNDNGSEQLYWTGLASVPLLMSLVAVWLASTIAATDDMLARPIARATLVFAGLSVLGSVSLVVVTYGQM